MPRYEFVEGSSRKFWEITLEGKSFTTHWGRIGTEGQSKTKSFASAEAARTEYDKLVAEKVGKGYRLVSGSAVQPAKAGLASMTDVPAVPPAEAPAAEASQPQATRPPARGEEMPDIPLEEKCPACGRNLVIRNGPYSDFVCCAVYPACRWALPTAKSEISLKCPACHAGELREQKPGLYCCSRAPQCSFASGGPPRMSMSKTEKIGIAFALLFLFLAAASGGVLLFTPLPSLGLLWWVRAAVLLAAVVALLGAGRGGFLHHDVELQFLPFVALLIAAVVVPLAARGAPQVILWLIPGGALLVMLAMRLGESLVQKRRQQTAASPVAPAAPPAPPPTERQPRTPVPDGPGFLREKNGIAILQVSSPRFEFESARLFAGHIAALLQKNTKQIVVDLGQVRSIGATGVGALMDAHLAAHKVGAEIKVIASPRVQQVLESTGLATKLASYPDEDSAVSAYHSGGASASNKCRTE